MQESFGRAHQETILEGKVKYKGCLMCSVHFLSCSTLSHLHTSLLILETSISFLAFDDRDNIISFLWLLGCSTKFVAYIYTFFVPEPLEPKTFSGLWEFIHFLTDFRF